MNTRYVDYLAADMYEFQSTHPSRDATVTDDNAVFAPIGFQSTHPSRDATCRGVFFFLPAFYFNPRIPHGMRRKSAAVTLPTA